MTAFTMSSPHSTTSTARPVAATRERDIRLDFFRGIAMFIILVAHIPSDWLALWIPARFGFSDATEMFVFCSGMASAIAFGAVYRNQGWLTGTARVAFRIWQVYWAHIALFFSVAGLTAVLVASGWFEVDHVRRLNLYLFFNDPLVHLPALLTLTYVPNFFDILPMYIVVLAMMPVVMALARQNVNLPVFFVVTVWLLAYFDYLALPAEPLSNRPWFFNPFGWQLVFFTGFAFSMGWLPAPPVDRRLVWAAVAVVVLSVPFSSFRLYDELFRIDILQPALKSVRPTLSAWLDGYKHLFNKTDFGLLRYVHFLALAYLAYVAVGPKGARLSRAPASPLLADAWGAIRSVIVKVGQQSLAVFVFSMFLAQVLGAVLDAVGRSAASAIWVNIAGFVLIATAAYVAAWFKAKPWSVKKAQS
ncbi:MAG: OpgC domain-containing protein [Tabrizicola sp.]|nr:OpgC domain-containing protein [Tabrizicola sp.]